MKQAIPIYIIPKIDYIRVFQAHHPAFLKAS